jgi:uncharacterized membrane protein YhaH (DUF805 family)
MGLTNSREMSAFFAARAIVVVITIVMQPLVLTPLYMQLFRSGGAIIVTVATMSVTVVAWLITLVLFLALRGGFGGVPPRVAGYGRRDAVTSSAAEIVAFLIAALIIIAAVWSFSVFVLTGIYASLRQSGQLALVLPISLGVSTVSAVLFFLIFIAMRGAMPGAASADGPLETYDDGGETMGFGKAIATCLRKYAVFSGRASRSEYWFFVLFETLLFAILIILDIVAFRGFMNVLLTLALLILFLPRLAVLVRRLHDTDKSGWWMLIPLVPVIGSIWLIVILCRRGTDGANRFGMGPATVAISEVFA